PAARRPTSSRYGKGGQMPTSAVTSRTPAETACTSGRTVASVPFIFQLAATRGRRKVIVLVSSVRAGATIEEIPPGVNTLVASGNLDRAPAASSLVPGPGTRESPGGRRAYLLTVAPAGRFPGPRRDRNGRSTPQCRQARAAMHFSLACRTMRAWYSLKIGRAHV